MTDLAPRRRPPARLILAVAAVAAVVAGGLLAFQIFSNDTTTTTGADSETYAPPTELPRYVLPAPWELESVEDMGIWTDEQQAEQEALEAANAVAGGVQSITHAQGFRRTNASDRGTGLPIPEVRLRLFEVDDSTLGDQNPFATRSEAISVAGFEGRLEVTEFSTLTGQTVVATSVIAVDATHIMLIEAPGLASAEVEAFVSSLTPRGDRLVDGFEFSDDYEMTVNLTDDDARISTGRQWHSAYNDTDRDTETATELELELGAALLGNGGTTLNVYGLSPEQYLLWLLRDLGASDDGYEPSADGRFLLSTTEYETYDLADGAGGVTRRTLLRYDPATGVLVQLTTHDVSTAELIELFDSLEEIELDEWTELVTPINAGPSESG